jgi:lysophospholipase L1-like esterase
MLQQVLYFFYIILILPFLPIFIYMAKRVRNRIPDLPEASISLVDKTQGSGSEIQLLAIGESAFAGVGVTDHKDGMIGSIAQEVFERTQNTVKWQVLARNGYTAKAANLKLVPKIPESIFHCVIIGLGANDTFRLNSPLTFKKNMIRLIEGIQKRQPQASIVIAQMPPVRHFIAFPWILRQVLGNFVDLHGTVIRDLPDHFDNVHYIDEKITLKDWIKKTGGQMKPKDFFSDGVHPSAMTYRVWGKEVGTFIVNKGLVKQNPPLIS